MGAREIFKQNLKFYRKKAGLTQEKLSEKCGFNLNYIAEIERPSSRFPKPETVDAIAAALGIKVSALFDEEGCPKNTIEFDKRIFSEKISRELGEILKREMLNYFKKTGI